VELGVRPEDVYLVEHASDLSAPSDPITAWTDVLEPMGDEIFVYLRMAADPDDATREMGNREGAGGQLLMSVPPDSDLDVEESVDVVLDRANVHSFDDASGEALAHSATAAPGDSGGASDAAEGDD